MLVDLFAPQARKFGLRPQSGHPIQIYYNYGPGLNGDDPSLPFGSPYSQFMMLNTTVSSSFPLVDVENKPPKQPQQLFPGYAPNEVINCRYWWNGWVRDPHTSSRVW